MDSDKTDEKQMEVTGVSQITISKKWFAIITAVVVVFVIGVGWMYQVVATARPISAEYAKQHNLKVPDQPE